MLLEDTHMAGREADGAWRDPALDAGGERAGACRFTQVLEWRQTELPPIKVAFGPSHMELPLPPHGEFVSG